MGTEKKILLLEDNLEFGHFLTLTLRRLGLDVRHVLTVTDAMAELEKFEFHLVITDVFIRPGGRQQTEGGITLLWRVREKARVENRRIPVIAITGAQTYPGMEDTLEVMSTLGADAVFEKPFDPADIVEKIGELLAGKSSETTSSKVF